VFISTDYQLKLADFGFTIAVNGRDGSGLLRSFKGSRPYMAPEILERREYRGIEVDLFACMIIIFISLTGKPPFIRAEPANPTYKLIMEDNWPLFWTVFDRRKRLSEEFRDLMERTFSYEPRDRLPFDEVLQHAWLTSTDTASREEAATFLSKVSPMEIYIPSVATSASSRKGDYKGSMMGTNSLSV
jgi:serine/threonine protein kinase